MNVKKVNHGTIHRVAFCQDSGCEWEDAYGGSDGRSIEAIARSAKNHTKKTGHSVVVESGASFQYQAS